MFPKIFFCLLLLGATVLAENADQPRCNLNEVFKECGTACEPSCDNLSPVCTLQCIPNVCQCALGFVRSNQGCIPPTQCSTHGARCGTNEEFKSCGTTCEPTCTNPNPVCNKMCQLDVCQCKKDYLRDGSGECVLPEKCNPCENYTCPPGQHCEPQIVQCVRAPCPPLPNCVDNA